MDVSDWLAEIGSSITAAALQLLVPCPTDAFLSQGCPNSLVLAAQEWPQSFSIPWTKPLQ